MQYKQNWIVEVGKNLTNRDQNKKIFSLHKSNHLLMRTQKIT